MQNTERPLSPHLQIYRLQLTSMMSIFHRMTGVALVAGLLLVTWGLVATAVGPGAYSAFVEFNGSPLGLLMLFGWSVALYYHLFNGIRHLIWDTGHLLKLRNAYMAGYAVLVLTILATAVTWYYGVGF